MSEQTNENPTGEQTADQDAPQNVDAQERTQGQPKPRYVDPNSGAAPQPGGYAMAPVADPEQPEAKADNVTMPEEARDLSDQGQGDGEQGTQDQGIEELPDDLIRSQSYDTELQNQAAPLGPQPGVEERSDGGDPSSEDGADGGVDGTADGTEDGAKSGDETEESVGNADEPAGNASLEEWQAYAKSRGATDEDLADKGRNDLRSEYGSN